MATVPHLKDPVDHLRHGFRSLEFDAKEGHPIQRVYSNVGVHGALFPAGSGLRLSPICV